MMWNQEACNCFQEKKHLMFRDQYHPAVRKDLKKLDSTTRSEIKTEWIPVILEEPDGGGELSGPLHGIRSFQDTVN